MHFSSTHLSCFVTMDQKEEKEKFKHFVASSNQVD